MWQDYKIHNVAHKLLVKGEDGWEFISQNVQCHSQSVGHRITCHDEIPFHNVTYKLFPVVERDVMRLLFTELAMSPTICWLLEMDVTWKLRLPFTKLLTCYWPEQNMWWACQVSHWMFNPTHFLLVIGKDVMRLPFTKIKMCNLTHFLPLVIWKDVMRMPFTIWYVWYHSQAVGYKKWCHETAFHKMYNLTHFLLFIGCNKNFVKCAMPLTPCQSLHHR